MLNQFLHGTIKIPVKKFSEEEKDSLYEDPRLHRLLKNLNDAENKESEKPYIEILKQTYSNINLYANVIRNCELIDNVEFKVYHVTECMNFYLMLAHGSIYIFETEIHSLPNDELKHRLSRIGGRFDHDDEVTKIPLDEIRDSSIYFQKRFIFLITELIASEALGTPKLRLIFDEISKSTPHKSFSIFLTMLYLDLRLPNYIEKLESLVKNDCKSAYYQDLILQKLYLFYSLTELPAKERELLENIISGLIVRKRGEPKQVKSRYIKEVQKSRHRNPQ